MLIDRDLSVKIAQLSRKFPIISITGPRQSGKTTLAKMCFPHYHYANLEMPDIRMFAEKDPRSFLARSEDGLIIDEAQYVPELFSYIQGISDESGKTGEFILTGSQNFLLLEKITQSLAGRVAVLNLMPFSYKELKSASLAPEDYLSLLIKGSYPAVYDKQIDPDDFFPSYIQSYLERDVRNIINVNNLSAFRNFLGVVAGRTGQLVNASSISNEIGVDQKTIKSWLAVLEASYIIFFLRPYHKNFNKRLVKSPKLYFYDTGLVCSLLGIKGTENLSTHYLRGALFENFIISEISKYYLNKGKKPDIFFWRNNTGNEVDCIVDEGIYQKIIEIKSGSTLHQDFFSGLEYYRRLSGISAENCYLIYGGIESQARSNSIVLSWTDLEKLFQ